MPPDQIQTLRTRWRVLEAELASLAGNACPVPAADTAETAQSMPAAPVVRFTGPVTVAEIALALCELGGEAAVAEIKDRVTIARGGTPPHYASDRHVAYPRRVEPEANVLADIRKDIETAAEQLGQERGQPPRL